MNRPPYQAFSTWSIQQHRGEIGPHILLGCSPSVPVFMSSQEQRLISLPCLLLFLLVLVLMAIFAVPWIFRVKEHLWSCQPSTPTSNLQPVSQFLRTQQHVDVQKANKHVHLALIAVLIVLMSWPDTSFVAALMKGSPAVGYLPPWSLGVQESPLPKFGGCLARWTS